MTNNTSNKNSRKNSKNIPKSLNEAQKRYRESIYKCDISICTGPSGSSKSYTAMSVGLELLQKNYVKKIVITRPTVEAGYSSLGFLPGGEKEKTLPYIKPLYDIIRKTYGPDKSDHIINNKIENIPIQFLRGNTIDDAFFMIDESQNMTDEEMKLCLTRIGKGSKCVINGDINQIDLKNKDMSGLPKIIKRINILEKFKYVYQSDEKLLAPGQEKLIDNTAHVGVNIGHINMSHSDIVRSSVNREIEEIYRISKHHLEELPDFITGDKIRVSGHKQ